MGGGDFGGWSCTGTQAASCTTTLHKSNMACSGLSHVSGSDSSLSMSIRTVEKCNEKVVAECANKEFFTYRSSNGACHCVQSCGSPTANIGLNIYSACTTTTTTGRMDGS